MYVYILTSGSYSDYGIDAVFAHENEQDMDALAKEFRENVFPALAEAAKQEDGFGYVDLTSEFAKWLKAEKGFVVPRGGECWYEYGGWRFDSFEESARVRV